MKPRTFIRESDGKVFTEQDFGTPLYHPRIVATDGELDVVKCYSYDGYVSLDKGHTYKSAGRI
jgi:hypothetical protein